MQNTVCIHNRQDCLLCLSRMKTFFHIVEILKVIHLSYLRRNSQRPGKYRVKIRRYTNIKNNTVKKPTRQHVNKFIKSVLQVAYKQGTFQCFHHLVILAFNTDKQ